MTSTQLSQLDTLKSNISSVHLNQMDHMTDEQLINTWKIYRSKSKRYKKDSKEEIKYASIATYALYLHKQLHQ